MEGFVGVAWGDLLGWGGGFVTGGVIRWDGGFVGVAWGRFVRVAWGRFVRVALGEICWGGVGILVGVGWDELGDLLDFL